MDVKVVNLCSNLAGMGLSGLSVQFIGEVKVPMKLFIVAPLRESELPLHRPYRPVDFLPTGVNRQMRPLGGFLDSLVGLELRIFQFYLCGFLQQSCEFVIFINTWTKSIQSLIRHL
jgi:hypothetical protein